VEQHRLRPRRLASDRNDGFTAREEAANALTHAIGAALGAVALVLLLVEAERAGRMAVGATFVFGAALVLVYLSSALHHGSSHERVKRGFLLCDRCAIYLLIAGTYTPITLISLPASVGRPLAAGIWLLALFGIALEVAGHFRGGLGRLAWLPVPLYLGMGWLGFGVAGDALAAALSPAALQWLLAGGVVYSAGVIFYLWRRLPYGHAVWHLFAVAGSACHVWSVLGHILPGAAA